jgi:hypothetical protein
MGRKTQRYDSHISLPFLKTPMGYAFAEKCEVIEIGKPASTLNLKDPPASFHLELLLIAL